MTPEELTRFYQSIAQSYEAKKSAAHTSLHNNLSILTDAYHDYEKKNIKVLVDQKADLQNSRKLWSEKKCGGCGSKLNLITSDFGAFWGCPRFRDARVIHTRFSSNQELMFSYKEKNLKVRINAHWATDILKNTNLTTAIAAKELIGFYTDVGLEDLREKYGYKSTVESISGYVNAKKNSGIEEDIITKHLSTLFEKTLVQMGIRYKLDGEREKVAIIDLVLSDRHLVNVIEIKRSSYDVNPKQLNLYYSLVSHILSDNADTRKCRAVFIVYNREEHPYSDGTKYLLYDDIRDIQIKETLVKIFEKNSHV